MTDEQIVEVFEKAYLSFVPLDVSWYNLPQNMTEYEEQYPQALHERRFQDARNMEYTCWLHPCDDELSDEVTAFSKQARRDYAIQSVRQVVLCLV